MPTSTQHTSRISIARYLKMLQSADNDFPYKIEFSFSSYIEKLKESYKQTDSIVIKAILDTFSKTEEELNSVTACCPLMEDKASNMLMPQMIFDSEKAFISRPFSYNFTKTTGSLDAFLKNEDWEIMHDGESIDRNKMIINAGLFILQNHYNIHETDLLNEQIKFIQKSTGHLKFEDIKINLDFLEVKCTQPLLPLDREQIKSLLQNAEDIDLWLRLLPPDRFLFKGFTIGQLQDVTNANMLIQMRQQMSKIGKSQNPTEVIHRINTLFRSYIGDKDLRIGVANLKHVSLLRPDSESVSITGLLDISSNLTGTYTGHCIYSDAVASQQIEIVEDLEEKDELSPIEKVLLKKGIRSITVIPIVEKGNTISIIEIASYRPLGINSITLAKLSEMIELLKESVYRYTHEVDKEVTLLIRKYFTNIHPSVEWKFQEVATRHYLNTRVQGNTHEIAPIVFNNVYPLYAQADVVSSSKKSEETLKLDLEINLTALNALLDHWGTKQNLFLLKNYKTKIDSYLEKIQLDFTSSDESIIIDFLHNTVHPHLQELSERHINLNDKNYQTYLETLDPTHGIVYKHRKVYDNSINKLNQVLSSFFLNADNEMQNTLPHFFEKYNTDGIEYNIYLGQSLLKNQKFSENDLKEFRLWQLKTMIDATRLVQEVSPTLAIPLTTAQLIFVYNNPLNIRFRMEEKKFDVDGSYNVRYEIIKKRIDKASIKGTEKRLTIANTISIVYINEKDRREYEEYIEYLIQEEAISKNVEYLELNQLPGADGLKAIRLTLA